MPANLTQQYHRAEREYREAVTSTEELACLQTMLVELPKHKGTDKLQADLKAKISRLKDEILRQQSSPSRAAALRIPKQGAGRAILIGGPNSGKSKLLSILTRATPHVAEYPFTTREPLPGMMPWQDVYVQLIDTPAITNDVFDPVTQGLVRGADLVLFLLDLGSDDGGEEFRDVLRQFQRSKTRLGASTRIDPLDIGVTYTNTLIVPNKIDLSESADRMLFFEELIEVDLPRWPISCNSLAGVETLRDEIYKATHAIRIYTKSPARKDADMEKPFTLKAGSTLVELAELIHEDLAINLKGGRIWGSVTHPGTAVKPDYVLQDGDIVEIHTS